MSETQQKTQEYEARALALVMWAGRVLLENGAEVFRVHETMTIMAHSYGLTNYNDYVLTNGLFASADGTGIAAVRDVPRRSVHLGRVEAVANICPSSRRLRTSHLDDSNNAAISLVHTPV